MIFLNLKDQPDIPRLQRDKYLKRHKIKKTIKRDRFLKIVKQIKSSKPS